jgi:putative inorganic carbon (HCO3(-)) transporter
MGSILLYVLFAANGVFSLIHPWVGVLLTYGVILLTPQNIWWWAFDGMQPVQWLVIPTLVGAMLAIVRGLAQWRLLGTVLCGLMAALILFATFAYLTGPFVDVVNPYRFYDPAAMYDVVLKAYVLFFAAALLLDSPRKLAWSFAPLALAGLYLAYWANGQYFFNGRFGRIGGPIPLSGASIYADENIFATVFVVCFPLLLCLTTATRSRIVALLSLGAIPMLWHAAFLTASRGALVAMSVVLLAYIVKGRRFKSGVVMGALFVVALLWQGGDTLLERSTTIIDYRNEESASSRLDAWQAAMRMMAAHPLSGVGFASFGQAYPSFSDTVPRIAHNTFFQIGAEWGVAAGVAYLLVVAGSLLALHRSAKPFRSRVEEDARWWVFAYDALFLALLGFFTCSMFLSLEKFELFHYLMALVNATLVLGGARRRELAQQSPSEAGAMRGSGRNAPSVAPEPQVSGSTRVAVDA